MENRSTKIKEFKKCHGFTAAVVNPHHHHPKNKEKGQKGQSTDSLTEARGGTFVKGT